MSGEMPSRRKTRPEDGIRVILSDTWKQGLNSG